MNKNILFIIFIKFNEKKTVEYKTNKKNYSKNYLNIFIKELRVDLEKTTRKPIKN